MFVCIDKESSAEPFGGNWFDGGGGTKKVRNAVYVYLCDVQRKGGMDLQNTLKQSSWFTWGWTLFALSHVVFCDREWKVISEKQNRLAEIFAVTGIGAKHIGNISGASVAIN